MTAEIAALRARVAELEAALLGVREHTLSDGPCWCVLGEEPGDEHTSYCECARAALAPRSERREGEPAKSHTVCIGWTTIQRVAKEGAVWFEDAGVGLVAADDLFHADVWQAAPPAAPKEEAK